MAEQRKQRILYSMGDLRDFFSTEERQREVSQGLALARREKQDRRADPPGQFSPAFKRVLVSRDPDGRARWATRSAWLEDGSAQNE